MRLSARRKVAVAVFASLALVPAGACGSGSGTDEDRGVPAGPEDAGTTGGTSTPTPSGEE